MSFVNQKAAPAAFFHALTWAACLVLGLGLGLATVQPAQASDLIAERAWFEDTTGKLDLQEARLQTFTPYRSVLSRGVGKGNVWIRLRMDPQLGKDSAVNARTALSENPSQAAFEKIALKIRPIYLDRIELFDPLDQQGLPRITGDLSAPAQDDIQSLTFGFLIPRGTEPRDIYLKLSSSSTRILHAEALPLTELASADRNLQIASGVYIGISTLFLLWGVITWLLGRERLVLAYVASQLCMVLFGFTSFGYIRFFIGDAIGPVWVSHIMTFSGISSVAASVLFYHELYREFSPPRWGMRFMQLGFALFFVETLLLMLGQTSTAVQINWMYLSVAPVIMFAMAFFCKGWANPQPGYALLPRAAIAGYFGVLLLFYVYLTTSTFWAIDGGTLSIYTGLGNGITSGTLAFVILQYRAALNQRLQARLATELAVTQSAAEQEREHRVDQERLMAMLAHEIRTPLSVITLALNQTQEPKRNHLLAKDAIRDIGDIIDQCLEVDLLNLSRGQSLSQPVSLSDMLAEVCQRIPVLAQRLASTGDQQIQVQTDPRLLRLILVNLFTNAVRYGAPDQPIGLRIQPISTDRVELTVSNAAGSAGTPDPKRVFEKYYRAPAAKRYSGTGLGLYLAKAVAVKLGGDLRYAYYDHQIEFTLCLPLIAKV